MHFVVDLIQAYSAQMTLTQTEEVHTSRLRCFK